MGGVERHVPRQPVTIWFISSDCAAPKVVPFKDFTPSLDVDSAIRDGAHRGRETTKIIVARIHMPGTFHFPAYVLLFSECSR